MDATQIIIVMVLVSVCILAVIVYTKQFVKLFGVLRNSLVGCLGILACNYLLAATGLAVGINLLTAFIVGILGIPGFLLLYITQFIVV